MKRKVILMKKIEVFADEYAALLNVEQMVRVAMKSPDTGEFLLTALAALDLVRKDMKMEFAEPKRESKDKELSPLAKKLLSQVA